MKQFYRTMNGIRLRLLLILFIMEIMSSSIMCSCFYTVFATDLVYIHPQTEFDIFADFDLFFSAALKS